MPERGATLLTGWGRTSPSAAIVIAAADRNAVAAAIANAANGDRPNDRRGVIGRGLGRSYGDAAQNAGGVVVDCVNGNGAFTFDARDGTVTAGAGASFDQILAAIVPAGYFVPVTPGTRHVTVGGAIAADIHGKNHHVDGSFGRHVRSLTMRLASGEQRVLTPDGGDEERGAFWATVGGMGLTGLIESVTFECQPIATSRLLVDTSRANDLDEIMALMAAADGTHRYSVAWIDLMATGRSLGRSVLTAGDFAPLAALRSPATRAAPHAYSPRTLVAAPPWVPSGVLNRMSIRAFNELWFRKAPRRRSGELQSIGTFFHPLDGVAGWNRLYGGRGFVQHQTVVPFGREDVLRAIVERLASSGAASFLAVLKRFGASSPAPLSFPMPGWTLALDLPVGTGAIGPLLDELDEMAVGAGGRVYLAKDARVRPELVGAMYPRLGEWRDVVARLDPDGVFQSDLSRRLNLVERAHARAAVTR